MIGQRPGTELPGAQKTEKAAALTCGWYLGTFVRTELVVQPASITGRFSLFPFPVPAEVATGERRDA